MTKELELISADSAHLSVLGFVDVNLNVQGLQIPHCLYVLSNLSQNVLLGNDWLSATNCVIDFGRRVLTVYDGLITIPLVALHNANLLARLASNVHIPAHTQTAACVLIPRRYIQANCIGLLKAGPPLAKQAVILIDTTIPRQARKVICQLFNNSDKPRTLYKHTPIALCQDNDVQKPIITAAVTSLHTSDNDTTRAAHETVQHKSPLLFDEKLIQLRNIGLKLDNDNLSADQMQQLVNLLFDYKEVFCSDVEQLPLSNLPPVEIKLTDYTPIRSKRYPLSHQHEILLDNYIQSMLKANIIRPSHSSWSSPVLVIKKSNYDPEQPLNPKAARIVVDLRKVNSRVLTEHQALISIDSVLSQVSDARATMFSSFDFLSGYLQLAIKNSSSPITAFSSRHGSYEFTRAPMGCAASSGQFLGSLYNLFQDELRSERFALYSDDGFVYTPTFTEQIKLLKDIFEKLRITKLRLSPTKSDFCKSKMEFLSYEFTADGVRISPSRIDKIKAIQPAKNLKELRSISGFFQYWRRFIPAYAQLTSCWRSQLKTGHKFGWTTKCDETLTRLKELLLKNALLIFPNLNEKFTIECDASSEGIGCVLLQKVDGLFRPIAFAGRAMKGSERCLGATQSELLAILFALSTFKIFLGGAEKVDIITDHCCLKYIDQLKHSNSPKLVRYSLLLQGFRYNIIYRAGKKNTACDFLSRYPTLTEKNDDTVNDPIMDVKHHDCLAAITRPDLTRDEPIVNSKRCPNYRVTTIRYAKRVPLTSPGAQQVGAIGHTNTSADNAITDDLTADQQQERNNVHTSLSDVINLSTQTENDEFLTALILYLTDNQLPNDNDLARRIILQETDFFIRDNKLFHSSRLGKRLKLRKLIHRQEQLVVPPPLRLAVMRQYHDLSHYSLQKCYISARKFWFWRHMYTDFYEYIQSCPQCVLIKGGKTQTHPRHALEVAMKPFQNVQVDFHSILVRQKDRAQQVYKHVFSIICQNTQFLVLRATKDQTAETVARELWRYSLKYGMFSKLISDRSKSFINSVFKAFITLGDTQAIHCLTSGFFPASNGLIERTNSALLKMIRTGCRNKLEFREFLPIIESVHNATHNLAIGCSPYFALVGQDFVSYVDSLASSNANSVRAAILPQGLEFIRDQLALLRQLTHAQVTEARQAEKIKHDQTAVLPEYKIGQKVFVSHFFRHDSQQIKHDTKFFGPFIITAVNADRNILRVINFNTGKEINHWINFCHIRPAEDERRDRLLKRLGPPNDCAGPTSLDLPDSLLANASTSPNLAGTVAPLTEEHETISVHHAITAPPNGGIRNDATTTVPPSGRNKKLPLGHRTRQDLDIDCCTLAPPIVSQTETDTLRTKLELPANTAATTGPHSDMITSLSGQLQLVGPTMHTDGAIAQARMTDSIELKIQMPHVRATVTPAGSDTHVVSQPITDRAANATQRAIITFQPMYSTLQLPSCEGNMMFADAAALHSRDEIHIADQETAARASGVLKTFHATRSHIQYRSGLNWHVNGMHVGPLTVTPTVYVARMRHISVHNGLTYTATGMLCEADTLCRNTRQPRDSIGYTSLSLQNKQLDQAPTGSNYATDKKLINNQVNESPFSVVARISDASITSPRDIPVASRIVLYEAQDDPGLVSYTAIPKTHQQTRHITKIIAAKLIRGARFGKIRNDDKTSYWLPWHTLPEKVITEYLLKRYFKAQRKRRIKTQTQPLV